MFLIEFCIKNTIKKFIIKTSSVNRASEIIIVCLVKFYFFPKKNKTFAEVSLNKDQ